MNVLMILKWFVAAIIEKCDADTARKIAESVLDKIDNYFEQTKNKADDLLIEVIRRCIREPFGISDNDDVEKDVGKNKTAETAESAGGKDDVEKDTGETATDDDAGGNVDKK